MVPDVKTCVTCKHDTLEKTPERCKGCVGWELWEPAESPEAKVEIIDKLLALKAEAPVPVADEAGGALKADTGKVPMSLLPRSALVAEAEVLAFGAKKYAAHNWRKGMVWSRLADAALRHLTAWIDGEDTDPETGLSHLAHLRCCAGFLIEYQQKGLGHDDRHTAA